jgi:ribonuclease P protein component
MSLQGREKFPKSARLRKRPEFLKLSRAGHKHQSANFVVISRPNDRAETRLGITVSGKVGNSVVRNRIKRQVREFSAATDLR